MTARTTWCVCASRVARCGGAGSRRHWHRTTRASPLTHTLASDPLAQPSPVAPVKKATKKVVKKKAMSSKGGKKKAARAVLGERNINTDDVMSVSSGASKASSKKKRSQADIERTYQKKTQLEHILLRPDTYGTRAAGLWCPPLLSC